VTVVLFDFGGTLADEHWMRAPGPPFPGFTDAYLRVKGPVVSEWECGRVTTDDLAQRIALELRVDRDAVRQHIAVLCRQLVFFDSVMTFARERRADGHRQALVTVNPDLFDDIVDCYGLDAVFDPIVTSFERGTSDKLALCACAVDRLNTSIADAVLIDNVAANVDAFRAAGGRAYLFVDDETFAADLKAGRIPGL
jgi:FMN phosphatase YigB (HAD superfamily)